MFSARRSFPIVLNTHGFLFAGPGRYGDDYEAQVIIACVAELEVRPNFDTEGDARLYFDHRLGSFTFTPDLPLSLNEVPNLFDRLVHNCH